MHIELITTAFAFILGFQTLTLIVLILRNNKKSISHRLLVLMLSFYLLSLLNLAIFYTLRSFKYFEWIPFLQLELLFGFGPSLYLYTKSLTDRAYKFTKKELIHFIPAIFEFVFYRTPFFSNGAIGLTESSSSVSNIVYLFFQWGGLISVIIYLIISIYLLIKFKRWTLENHSNLENRQLQWYKKPVVVYSIFWLIWITIRVSDVLVFDEFYRPYYFHLGFMVLAAITLWIGFKGYVTSLTNVSGFLGAATKKSQGQKEGSLYLVPIAESLKQTMFEKKYYLDSDLTLAKLALNTKYSERDISKALNTCLNLNFHEFVNQYRVHAFKDNLQQKEFANLNLLGVALESGFGSKSTFNLVFKSNTGLTPKQYLKRISE